MVTGKWLTVQQVSEILQVRIETVRRWIRRGDIPVLDIGGPRTVYRIKQADLDEFIRERFRPGTGVSIEIDSVSSDEDGAKSGDASDDGLASSAVDAGASGQIRLDLVEHIPAVTFREERRNAGNSAFLSREIETMLGYTVEDLTLRPGGWLDVVHPDDRARVEAELARTDETGDPFRMEYRMIRQDGRTVWISVDAILVGSSNGGGFWEGAIVDVTERHELEAELRRRELQQQTIADLGRVALEGAPISSLLRQAAQRVSAAMDASRVIIYEVLPGGTLLTERGHFHQGSFVEPDDSPWMQRRNGEEADPLTTYAADLRQAPVVSERLAEDPRFAGAEMESVLGASSGCAILIPGRVRPFGVLTVLSTEQRATSNEDLLFLQSVVNIIGSAVAQADNHWLTVTEVAELLQVTEDTVRRWIRNLELPALSLGGARAGYRVYPSDLERFIQHRLKRLK